MVQKSTSLNNFHCLPIVKKEKKITLQFLEHSDLHFQDLFGLVDRLHLQGNRIFAYKIKGCINLP